MKWLCCQYGSREYYAIPRSLLYLGTETDLVTDLWIPPIELFGENRTIGSGRYHPDLKREKVKSFNFYFLYQHFLDKITSIKYPDRIFEKRAANWIEKRIDSINPDVIFSYSYASLNIFKLADRYGIRTILGQINPGPVEAEIVKDEFYREYGNKYKPTIPDERYWDRWKNETNLSDYVVVNSAWSAKLVADAGIPESKIRIIPLAYFRDQSLQFKKTYPDVFNTVRPLKILYLGSISIRKGFHLLKKTMNMLLGESVIVDVVGDLKGPEELLIDLPSNMIYHGRKTASEKDRFFRESDVFILPTLSDGFAITQLEAQFWKLPIIASGRCGRVVEDGVNGLIIEEDLQVETISGSIRRVLYHPEKLEEFSGNAVDLKRYSLESVGKDFLNIVK